jgi:hypothetical protein
MLKANPRIVGNMPAAAVRMIGFSRELIQIAIQNNYNLDIIDTYDHQKTIRQRLDGWISLLQHTGDLFQVPGFHPYVKIETLSGGVNAIYDRYSFRDLNFPEFCKNLLWMSCKPKFIPIS